MPVISSLALRLALVSFFTIFLGSDSLAIPRELLRQKLDAIPVFALGKRSGGFVVYESDKTPYIPLYLKSSQAEAQLLEISSKSDGSAAALLVAPLKLGSVYEQLRQLRTSKPELKKLQAPIFIPEKDLEDAITMQVSSGEDEKIVRSSMRVPVYFFEPMLYVKRGEKNMELFYFSKSRAFNDLNRAIGSSPSNYVLRVADLSGVIKFVLDDPVDRYLFVTD